MTIELTFDELRSQLSAAVVRRERESLGIAHPAAFIVDMGPEEVVYESDAGLMRCEYEVGDDGSVRLGEAEEVLRTYVPAAESEADDDAEGEQAAEAVVENLPGRVIEAKGTDAAGGRVFRVRIVAAGVSKNRRHYKEAVLRDAAHLYEGARAFDHHRTEAELATSTIAGLVGHYRNTEAQPDGIYGDLHLLPSATHAAEALDAAIEAQAAGLEPMVGISHDVRATFRVGSDQHGRLQEAEKIVSVDSADIVAKPSAGGKAVRVVAGGETTEEESDVPPTKAEILAAFQEASDGELAAVGLVRAPKTTESTTPPAPAQRVTEGTQRTTEAEYHAKDSTMGRMILGQKFTDAQLPQAARESITGGLADQFTESQVDLAIKGMKDAWALMERGGLTPAVGVQVTQESQEKKAAALDAFFAGDYAKGYKSFREAYLDFSGHRPRALGEDLNKRIMRECVGTQYDSEGRITEGERTTESMTAGTWNLVLGDSITRRMIALYNDQNFQTWRAIVSSIIPINDFRTQRLDRVGGYGLLPAVAEGGPYQPLTSPTNEEVTYAITKRGGTEDLTLEMIANDDVRAISNIPRLLGVAARNTLYRFVWDFITTNANIYDSTALFTTGHANYVNSGSGSALAQSSLTAARILMTSQTAYGDSTNFIAPTPKFLVFVNDLEEIAYQLTRSAVAIPSTPAGPSDTPNLHQGLTPIRLDYPSSTTAWWAIADPNEIPTIEVGFYQGRQEPELFTQSDPNVGSMFNADSLTYKLRHIYGGSVVEYRGMVRGN